jgi:hypothetical protein
MGRARAGVDKETSPRCIGTNGGGVENIERPERSGYKLLQSRTPSTAARRLRERDSDPGEVGEGKRSTGSPVVRKHAHRGRRRAGSARFCQIKIMVGEEDVLDYND